MLRARVLILILFALVSSARADDAGDLRAVVDRWVDVYSRRDAAAVDALWSAKSPEFESGRQSRQRSFAANDYALSDLAVSRIQIDGERASLRAAFKLRRTDLRTRRPEDQKLIRTFVLAREDGRWKIWKYANPVEELAAALVAAKTPADRAALVAADPELRTPELWQALVQSVQRSAGQKKYDEAHRILEVLRETAVAAGDREGEAEALHYTGHVYDAQHNPDAMIRIWRERLAMVEAIGKSAPLFEALHDLAHGHLAKMEYALALGYFERALKRSEEQDDKENVAHVLVDMGGAYRSLGNYLRARELYEKSLPIAEASGSMVRVAATLDALGHFQSHQGNDVRAEELFRRRLSIAEAGGNKAEIAHAWNDLASSLLAQGNFTAAIETCRRALAQYEGMNSKVGIADTLSRLANIYHVQGKYAEAIENNEKARAIFEGLGNADAVASMLGNTAHIHTHQKNYAAALEIYQKLLAGRESTGERAAAGHTRMAIASIHVKQKNYPQALELLQKELDAAESVGNRGRVGLLLRAMAHVHQEEKRYPRALELFERGIAIADELGDKAAAALGLNHVAEIYTEQREYDKGAGAIRKSLALAESLGNVEVVLRDYAALGKLEKARGSNKDAIAAYRRALEQLEALRARVTGGEEEQESLVQATGASEIYDGLVSLLAGEGATAEALSILERARSKQLLDAMRLRSLTVRDPALRDLLARTEQLESALAAQERARLAEISRPGEPDHAKVDGLTKLVAETRSELLDAVAKIREANPDFERFITIKATDLRAIQKKLPPNVVVVEYLPLEPALTTFLVTNKGIEAHSVAVSRHRLEELVSQVLAEIREAQKQDGAGVRGWDWQSDRARPLRDALTALYGYLIAPIQRQLAEAETVVIVPSGVLYYLPFQALARQQPDRSLTFLAEEKQLALLTSLQLWEQISAEASPARARSGRLGAFANPDGTLPATEQEARQVAALFERSLVYTGEKVTRAQVESLPNDVSRIHFATRARLDERDINECYLALANGEKLKLGEIYGLAGKYPAKMTILSGSETGLGRSDPGTEVAHLANGFVEAGSTTIVASLWQASNPATTRLLERFYRELRSGKSAAEAKRAAEIFILKNKETSHPYFWAPYLLIGDWR